MKTSSIGNIKHNILGFARLITLYLVVNTALTFTHELAHAWCVLFLLGQDPQISIRFNATLTFFPPFGVAGQTSLQREAYSVGSLVTALAGAALPLTIALLMYYYKSQDSLAGQFIDFFLWMAIHAALVSWWPRSDNDGALFVRILGVLQGFNSENVIGFFDHNRLTFNAIDLTLKLVIFYIGLRTFFPAKKNTQKKLNFRPFCEGLFWFLVLSAFGWLLYPYIRSAIVPLVGLLSIITITYELLWYERATQDISEGGYDPLHN